MHHGLAVSLFSRANESPGIKRERESLLWHQNGIHVHIKNGVYHDVRNGGYLEEYFWSLAHPWHGWMASAVTMP